MSMIKFVSPVGWDFQEQIVTPIKVSSRGLIGHDKAAFLKRASSSFLPQLDNVKFAKDEIPVHLIALGSSEAYGPNRNGDGFKEATCRKYHDTFVKFAKFFRNHKNKAERGDPFYGVVKASAYNEDMRRVELLCALNAEKSAADRNGGFIADAEIEKLARGEDIPVSMACRVPNDICSFCKNAARNRDEYCTGEKCAAGGCRSNLTRLVKVGNDLHHLHVDNPDPTWFDISRVFRPADRIAYGAKADYLTKSASDADWFDLQEYIKAANSSSAPIDVIIYQTGQHGMWNNTQTSQIKLAYSLAAMEDRIGEEGLDKNLIRGLSTNFPVEKLASYGSDSYNLQLAALADRGIILSFPDYLKSRGESDKIKSASVFLPNIYTSMTQDESLPLRVEAGSCSFIDRTTNEDARMLAASTYADNSLFKSAVADRGLLSCIREHRVPEIISCEKIASASEGSDNLARDYAMYKLAALWRTAAVDNNFPVTVRISLCQNRVI